MSQKVKLIFVLDGTNVAQITTLAEARQFIKDWEANPPTSGVIRFGEFVVRADKLLALLWDNITTAPIDEIAKAQKSIADMLKNEAQRGEEWRESND